MFDNSVDIENCSWYANLSSASDDATQVADSMLRPLQIVLVVCIALTVVGILTNLPFAIILWRLLRTKRIPFRRYIFILNLSVSDIVGLGVTVFCSNSSLPGTALLFFQPKSDSNCRTQTKAVWHCILNISRFTFKKFTKNSTVFLIALINSVTFGKVNFFGTRIPKK